MSMFRMGVLTIAAVFALTGCSGNKPQTPETSMPMSSNLLEGHGLTSGSIEATDGVPMVTAETRPFDDLAVFEGHDLAFDSIAVEAGATKNIGDVVAECPTDGSACTLNVVAYGTATYEETDDDANVADGHMPSHETNEMIRAANGPDGEHAVGLVTRIGTTNALTEGIAGPAMLSGSIVQSSLGAENEPEVTVRSV